MKALTIWQPWATLIMIGAKPYEWRRWRSPSRMIGERIVIHAGARKVDRDEVYELIHDCKLELRQIAAGNPVTHPTAMDIPRALPVLERVFAGETTLVPIGAGLGTAVLGEARLASDLGFPVDSDRLEHQNWGWPLTEIEPFAEPITMRGAQGLWTWNEVHQAEQTVLI